MDKAHRTSPMPALALLATLIAGAFLAGQGARPTDARDDVSAQLAQRQVAAPQQGDVPCGLTATRRVQPRVLEDGGDLEVEVNYRYSCPPGSRKANFFILVENSALLEAERRWDRDDFMKNLHDGLTNFVNRIDYAAGSQGGLILFAVNSNVREELRGPGQGQQTLLAQLNAIAPGGSASAVGVADAINAAMERLEAADPTGETFRFILILQAGGTTANRATEIQDACSNAKAKGATVALLTLPRVEHPLTSCPSEFWTRNQSRDSGEDLPDILTELGLAVSQGGQARQVEYCEEVALGFGFDESSAQPRPPDAAVLDEYCWLDEAPLPEEPPVPPEGYTIRYKLTAKEGTVNEIGAPSQRAEVRLTLRDARIAEIALPLDDVCVYKAGQAQYCDSFAARLTPSPTTPTPDSVTATPTATGMAPPATGTPTGPVTTPTVEEPTLAPTPTEASATPEPGGWSVFMPLTRKRG